LTRVWVDGRLCEAHDARVSVFDRGFLLGDGLFETMRAYGGRVFRLGAHLDRLRRSADRVGIRVPDGLDAAVRETLAANRLADAAVRLTVTRGAGPGVEPPADAAPTVVIAVRPPAAPPAEVRAAWARGRVNEHAATAGLKRLGYLDAIVEVAAARTAGSDDVLFLDTAGHLAEAAYSNLFLVAEGALWTPPLGCGVLPGITRAAVLEIARAEGWPVREEPLAPERLGSATEAFLTSSVREIVPLVSVGGRPVGAGRPGPVTARVRVRYAELVRSECG
jgi:branched-chain amino acid aminotransferase